MVLPHSPKGTAKLLLRVSFGVSLALIGLSHYMTLSVFTGMVSDGLGPLSGLGTLWSYVLPALEIVGGVLLVAGYREDIGAWAAGVALASISIGLLLKPVFGGAALGDVMPGVTDTLLWLLAYFFVVKSCLCGSCCPPAGGSMSGGHGGSCGC